MGVAARDRSLDAVAKMVFEHLGLDPRERGAGRLHLGQDVNAITAFVDHSRQPTHLTFDPAKTVEELRLILAFQQCLLIFRPLRYTPGEYM